MEFFVFLYKFIGLIIFFLPGLFLNLIIFKKSNILERAVYTIILAGSAATLVSAISALLGVFSFSAVIVFLGILSVILGVFVFFGRHELSTSKTRYLFPIIIISFLGAIWRIYLISRTSNFVDPYRYASHIVATSLLNNGSFNLQIPDLNFYTGMAVDRVSYLGGLAAGLVWQNLSPPIFLFTILISVFSYIGLAFFVIKKYSHKDSLAYFGALLLAIGPIEIWHSTLSFIGHPISYLALFSLFLLYSYKNKYYFIFALFVSLAAIVSYYTASVAIAIVSFGFIISSYLSNLFYNKKFGFKDNMRSDYRSAYFFIIFVLAVLFIFLFSAMPHYTSQNIASVVSFNTESTLPNSLKPYNPSFRIFGFSLIFIESFIFILFGFTFLINIMSQHVKTAPFSVLSYREHPKHERLLQNTPSNDFQSLTAVENSDYRGFRVWRRIVLWISKDINKGDLDLLSACIPVFVLSLAFYFVNLYARIFDYFAFFSIAAIKIRLNRKILIGLAFVILLFFALSVYHRNQEQSFLSVEYGEKEAALYIAENLNGTVFTDIVFANALILNKYYDVQGIGDEDKRNLPIYYAYDLNQSVRELKNLSAEYIAITKRMREDYILDLTFHQQPMDNEEMYENHYRKVYDNGNVRIYKIPNYDEENSSIS